MKTIVCHGDSLTEASDIDRNFIWPTLVQNRLQVNIINSGIGGDTTGGLLGRFYHDVVHQQADLVVILGGTNDLWWNLEVNIIQANVFAMACQAQHHQIAPLIGLPLPFNMEAVQRQDMMAPIGGWKTCAQKLFELVQALKTSAQESDIPCLDFYHLFFDGSGNLQEKYFLEDGLHPNKEGHRLMAEKMLELMRTVYYFE